MAGWQAARTLRQHMLTHSTGSPFGENCVELSFLPAAAPACGGRIPTGQRGKHVSRSKPPPPPPQMHTGTDTHRHTCVCTQWQR